MGEDHPASSGDQRLIPLDEDTAWPDAADPTGDAGVDQILATLPGLPQLPALEHTQAYTEMHDGLLAQLDAAPDGD